MVIAILNFCFWTMQPIALQRKFFKCFTEKLFRKQWLEYVNVFKHDIFNLMAICRLLYGFVVLTSETDAKKPPSMQSGHVTRKVYFIWVCLENGCQTLSPANWKRSAQSLANMYVQALGSGSSTWGGKQRGKQLMKRAYTSQLTNLLM